MRTFNDFFSLNYAKLINILLIFSYIMSLHTVISIKTVVFKGASQLNI